MITRDKGQVAQRDLLETYLKNILNPRHEPEALCIAKGTACTRYEFGSKVSVVTNANEGFMLDSRPWPATHTMVPPSTQRSNGCL